MEDAALLAAFVRDRSDEAFRELVRRHIAMVYAVCRRRLRDAHWAEDVTQAVFILLAKKAAQIPKEAVLGGWLYKTAFYACSNARDLKRSRNYHETRVMPMKNLDEQDPVERAEMEELLDGGLMELNKAQREVLILRYFENKSIAEVAKSRRQSLYATQKALDSGLARLRRILAQRGVTVGLAVIAAFLVEQSAKAMPVGLADSVGAAALGGTGAAPAHVAQLVNQLVRQSVRIKLMAALAGSAACVLLGLAGLAFGGNFVRAAWSPAPSGVTSLTPAQRAEEIQALWKTLHDTDVALRGMDTGALSELVFFTDGNEARQWNAMARVFVADLALKRDVSAKFGAAGPLTAIETTGERIDEELPAVDIASCRWEVNSRNAALRFGYHGHWAGGSIYFAKADDRWRIDATRTMDIALEGLNTGGKRDALWDLTADEQAVAWQKLALMEGVLTQTRAQIDSGQIQTLAGAQQALQQGNAGGRAFFRLALRFDDQAEMRK